MLSLLFAWGHCLKAHSVQRITHANDFLLVDQRDDATSTA